VIVGRLPEVSAQFDLVLTSRSGLEGLSRGFDATRLLKPGGTLCILGAVPGQQFRAELRSIRRMTADRVTFNARTFLDVPIPSELKECLRELESQSREIAISSASSVKFLPKPSTGSSETDRLEGERVFQTLAALFGVTVIQI